MQRYITLDESQLTPYKLGRISGIVYVIIGMPDTLHAWMKPEDSNKLVLTFNCTEEQYQAAVEVIEKVYPGVIIYEES